MTATTTCMPALRSAALHPRRKRASERGAAPAVKWRYYDPDSGRYLSPEPLVSRPGLSLSGRLGPLPSGAALHVARLRALSSGPDIAAGYAQEAGSLEIYSYAGSNPLQYFDPTGEVRTTLDAYCERHPDDELVCMVGQPPSSPPKSPEDPADPEICFSLCKAGCRNFASRWACYLGCVLAGL